MPLAFRAVALGVPRRPHCQRRDLCARADGGAARGGAGGARAQARTRRRGAGESARRVRAARGGVRAGRVARGHAGEGRGDARDGGRARARHSPLVRLVCDGVAVEAARRAPRSCARSTPPQPPPALASASAQSTTAARRRRAAAPASRRALLRARANYALQGGESRRRDAGGVRPGGFLTRCAPTLAWRWRSSPRRSTRGNRSCSAAADVDGAFGSVGSLRLHVRPRRLPGEPAVCAGDRRGDGGADGQPPRAADAANEMLTFVVVAALARQARVEGAASAAVVPVHSCSWRRRSTVTLRAPSSTATRWRPTTTPMSAQPRQRRLRQ